MPRSDGSCLNDALTLLLGYDPGLPDWVPAEENAAIAERLHLRYYEMTSVEITAEPAIFVVPTTGNRAHAYYVAASRIGEFLAWNTQPILCVFLRQNPLDIAP